MFYKIFDKKTGWRTSVNEQLAEELHKAAVKKFKKRKIYARFKGNIWAADLTEMESFPSKNKNVKYLLCVIDVFANFAWVKPLKDEKGKTALNTFIEIVYESNLKPNKLWVDQGREFYNKRMKEWLQNNDTLMHSAQGKSAIIEKFIETLNAKTYEKWQLMIGNLILVFWIN